MRAGKKGQITIFVIIALVIVAGIAAFLIIRDNVGEEGITVELQPVFDYYQSCIELETKLAIQIVGAQGGRINAGDYVPGSEYAPFSSHLNFLGSPVGYWYYVAANGVIKEQVPSKGDMEREMEEFIAEGISNCDFELFYRESFDVDLGAPSVKVDVLDNVVEIEVVADLSVSKGDDAGRKTSHRVDVNSKLGRFYDLAREIYEMEKSEAFLENYAVDVLNLYAPVDGVKIQCAPEIWSTKNVMDDIRKGLEENFRTIKFKGDYYELQGEDRDYFVLDKEVDEAVSVMYLKEWPTKIEVIGDKVDSDIMIAETIGTQEGMGAMGFCYVPYHFVYDVGFPAMFQIYNSEELFQFPVAVIIDKNLPRNGVAGEILVEEEEFDLCEYKTENIEVNIFDANLVRVDANVSFECFDQSCRLGESVNGKFVGRAPACVNGYLNFRAENYAEKKEIFSSNRERFADVILEREYEVGVELEIDNEPLEGTAIVSFVREDGKSRTIAMPSQSKVKLSEGSYDVRVHVYGNTSIVLPETTKSECVDVPKGGPLGFLGRTKEKCFDIVTPETKIDYALIGGGKETTYLLESEIRKEVAKIRVQSLPKPNSIEELGQNFEIFETRGLDIIFYEG